MHFYERIKQKFVYIYLFVLARRFYRFLKNFPNVGYDILERGYRYATCFKTRVSFADRGRFLPSPLSRVEPHTIKRREYVSLDFLQKWREKDANVKITKHIISIITLLFLDISKKIKPK